MADIGSTPALLSTTAASPVQRRFALAVVLLLLAALLVTLPFATVPLGRADAFIPAYEAALIIEEVATAALLYAQYAILRQTSLLILATGYLFTALMVVPHLLTFPGLFTPTGWLGAGPSTAAWIYAFWHIGFPLAVLAYAWNGDSQANAVASGSARGTILTWTLGSAALVVMLTILATLGETLLPHVMGSSQQRTSSIPYLTGSIWLFTAAVLAVLVQRRRFSVLDLWIKVVLCAWLCEIGLGVVLAPARFSVGFYFGRLYGLVAGSIVLTVLLTGTTTLYVQLARSSANERRERERRINEMEAMLSHLARVNDLGRVVTTLIHEVNQPLAAIGNYLSALQRLAAMGNSDKVLPTIEKTIGQSERAREIIRRLREFVGQPETERRTESLPETIEDAIAVAQAASGRSAGVDVTTQLDALATHVVIDRIQIEQVLVNLIRNATEAMANSPRRLLSITTRVFGDHKVEISIADTGPGLPAELRDRLFEPFVTTKSSGMGVGLSICRFIVEAHGEKLIAVDNPGGGTVFRFTLPAAPINLAATVRDAV